MKKNKLWTGAAIVAILAALGVVQGMLEKAAAQAKQVPRFEVDPYWPKPMPKNWVFGQTIGLRENSAALLIGDQPTIMCNRQLVLVENRIITLVGCGEDIQI